nr:unnamed protein product [Callosobruchus analis]
MGVTTNYQRNGNINYCHSIEELCRIMALRMFSPLKRYQGFYKFTSDYQKQKKALKEIDAFYENIISKKRQAMSPCSIKEEEDGSKQNFLDQLLSHQENGEALSDKNIRDEINTFMFGGHDTTATGLSFVLYVLARHPNVQEKILEEQEAIFGSSEKDPEVTYAHLQEMKYLEAAINEALRLYSPIPGFGRKLTGDIQLGEMSSQYLFSIKHNTIHGKFIKYIKSNEQIRYYNVPFTNKHTSRYKSVILARSCQQALFDQGLNNQNSIYQEFGKSIQIFGEVMVEVISYKIDPITMSNS